MLENADLTKRTKCTAANERFGATAAGRADLKGSAGMPPLTQSRHPVGCKYGESVVEKTLPEIVVETKNDLKKNCSSTIS